MAGSSTYEGARSDSGIREGKGRETFQDGTIYQGRFFADKKHGDGVEIFTDGSSYEGAYKCGLRDGKGTYRHADGQAHVGTFKNDEPVFGVLFSANRKQMWRIAKHKMVEIKKDEALGIIEGLGLGVPKKGALKLDDEPGALAEFKQEAGRRVKALAESPTVKKTVERVKKLLDHMSPHKTAPPPAAAPVAPATDDAAKPAAAADADEEDEAEKKEKQTVEKHLYKKFEKAKVRPDGVKRHEFVGFVVVFSVIIIPAAVLNAFPTYRFIPAPPSPPAAPPAAPSSPPASPPPPGFAHEIYADLAQGQYNRLVEISNYTFTIVWPAAWLCLILLGLAGRHIDQKYRKGHEVMRFRWEGTKPALYGLLNAILYVLLICFFIQIFALGAVNDVIVLVIKAVMGTTAIVLGWLLCFEMGTKRKKADVPSLKDVLQVKLDDKFQERVEGKRKYNKRNDKKAAVEFLTLLSCGAYKTDEVKNRAKLFPSKGEASRYVGEYNSQGEREGEGTERFADGTVYEGGFVGGRKHGLGTEAFTDGSVFIGEYEGGVRAGKGTYKFGDGRALVGTFKGDAAVAGYVVWSAAREMAWRELEGDLLLIDLDKAASVASKIGLPAPPIHDEMAAERDRIEIYAAAHPASPAARFRVFCYSILIAMVFGVALKLTGLTWFLLRSLVSVPLYGLVPRLFYVEWFVHFHQKHVINNLDYPAWRPTLPALAPFFFCVYLPKMGVQVPGIPRADPRWPDIDWPEIDWPELTLPKVQLSDLSRLLQVRFPNVDWPELPNVAFRGTVPSINLGLALGQLRVRFPNYAWPTLPGGTNSWAFPDWNLPGLSWDGLFAELQLQLPDMAWPALPNLDVDLPSFSIGDMMSTLRLRFPDLTWPTFDVPDFTGADLNVLLRLRFPGLALPTLPDLHLPELHLPSCNLNLVLGQLRLKFPNLPWPDLGGLGGAFPDWSLPSLALPDLFGRLQAQFPDLAWPALPDFSLPEMQLPAFTLPDLLNALQLKYPQLTWPAFDLPAFRGISLSALGLAIPSLGFGLPSLTLPIAALPNFNLPTFHLPAIDVNLPDLNLSGVSLPSMPLPTIPVPTMDFPVVDFEALNIDDWLPLIGGLACAFLVDLADDLKDFILVFGKASLLAKKALARKQRASATEELNDAAAEAPAEVDSAVPADGRRFSVVGAAPAAQPPGDRIRSSAKVAPA